MPSHENMLSGTSVSLHSSCGSSSDTSSTWLPSSLRRCGEGKEVSGWMVGFVGSANTIDAHASGTRLGATSFSRRNQLLKHTQVARSR